jgi:hypothetical protein
MSVGPNVWGPPSCEGLLCGGCVDVVNLTFSLDFSNGIFIAILIRITIFTWKIAERNGLQIVTCKLGWRSEEVFVGLHSKTN